jgi:hypothetical protein
MARRVTQPICAGVVSGAMVDHRQTMLVSSVAMSVARSVSPRCKARVATDTRTRAMPGVADGADGVDAVCADSGDTTASVASTADQPARSTNRSNISA